MEFITDRLRIVPLKLEDFKLLLDSMGAMEAALHLNPSGEMMNEHEQQAMEWLYKEACSHKEKYIWYTNWQIINRFENMAVGSLCFKGNPNKEGEVEIGYGIHFRFQRNGYMSEAAKSVCAWALQQTGVKRVIAETEKDNLASHQVLRNCGMSIYKETPLCYWWRIGK